MLLQSRVRFFQFNRKQKEEKKGSKKEGKLSCYESSEVTLNPETKLNKKICSRELTPGLKRDMSRK